MRNLAQSNYSSMVYPALLLLFFMNSLFLFTMGLPGDQAGHTTMGMGFDDNGASYQALYGTTTGFLDDTNNLLGPPQDDTNVDAFSGTRNYPESQKNWLFGAIQGGTYVVGLFGTLLNYIVTILFGYWFWLDYFFRPEWGLTFIGLPFKFFFFLIQLYGMFIPILNVFGIGLGSRSD